MNGVDENNQAALVSAPEGAYTYDIQVTQAANEDSSGYRSSTLSVSSSALIIVDPAEESAESPVDNQAHVTYSLSETPLSGSIHINYHYGVDDDSPQEQGPFSDQTRSESNPVSFEYGGDPNAYTVLTIFVIRAKDNQAAQHRDHQSKPMLPKNKVAAEKKKVFYHVYMLSGSIQANSSTYIERSQLWQTSSNAAPKMLHVWQNSDLYGGNSGSGSRMNSISSADQWSGFGGGGPTPEYDEVAENRSVQSELPLWLPYKIKEHQLDLQPGMKFEYKGEMRGWRWQISGRNLGDDGDWNVQTRYNVGGPGNQRQWLRIHIDLIPGTAGCLGIHDINSYVKLYRHINRLLYGNGVIAETGLSRVPLYVVEGGLFGGARPAADSNVGSHHPPNTKYSAYKIDGSGNVVKGQ